MKTLTFTLVLAATALYGQTQYEAIPLTAPPDRAWAEGRAINVRGEVVGDYWYNDFKGHAGFVYEPDSCKLIDLGTLGGRFSMATGINDSGLVVGISENKLWENHGFSYSYGVMQDLGGEEWASFEAWGVNNLGHAAGFLSLAGNSALMFTPGQAPPLRYLPKFDGVNVEKLMAINDADHGVTYQKRSNGDIWGVYYFLSDLPGWHAAYQIQPVPADPRVRGLERGTKPTAINQYGEVAGIAGITTTHAFFSPSFNKPAIDLGTLDPGNPSLNSEARGLNNNGLIVGWSQRTNVAGRTAFLYDGTTMIDLNTRLIDPTDWQLMEANAINDKGQIVGTGLYKGEQVAFLLLPKLHPSDPPHVCLAGNK